MTASHTLERPTSLLQEIRKSRFLAQAEPVDDARGALAVLARVSDPLATHNCWAYRIGQAYRFSDDGEPGGTAGRPILQAIEGQGFDRVVVVVTRWYGGTKLGAGGLVRAYGGCAAECLRTAPRVALVDKAGVRVHCAFAPLQVLRARLREFAAEVVEERFDGDGADLVLSLPREHVDALAEIVRDLTRGRGRFEVLDAS